MAWKAVNKQQFDITVAQLFGLQVTTNMKWPMPLTQLFFLTPPDLLDFWIQLSCVEEGRATFLRWARPCVGTELNSSGSEDGNSWLNINGIIKFPFWNIGLIPYSSLYLLIE